MKEEDESSVSIAHVLTVWGARRATSCILVFFLLPGVSGCMGVNNVRQQEPVYVNGEKFLANIVRPILQGIASIAESYAEKRRFPENQNALPPSSRFQFWERVDSDKYGTADAIFRLSFQPSTDPADGRGTSWLVFAEKVSAGGLRFKIAAESPVCARFERTYSDSMLGLFIDLAAGYAARSPLKRQSEVCFQGYSFGTLDARSEDTRKRLENLRDELRRETKP